MKYKKLTKEQILISIDRITRFKNTKNKYYRVFTDIILSNLIEPKFSKKDLETLDFALISEFASTIINSSLDTEFKNDILNKKIAENENCIFNNDSDTQKLLKNTINYEKVIEIIPEDCPINLKWLKSLISDNLTNIYKYPLKVICLVEGITEEILLPVFASLLGFDFNQNGIQLIAAGGKNQVVKMYYKLSQELKLPIFVLLDHDAKENIEQIAPKLRKNDKIHLVSCGEFEDLLPKSLIIRTVNEHFKNFLDITNEDLESDSGAVKVLEEIFKTKGLHEFKKAEFAKLVKENIVSENDISAEIRMIIEEISTLNKSLDRKICS